MHLRFIAPCLFVASLTALGLPAQATELNPLSVHVLNLQTGQPSAGIRVDLERRVDDAGHWQLLGGGITDEQGRIRALVPAAALDQWAAGDYRVVFRTGEFYARQQQASFFPEIPVVVRVDSAKQHYHVPLLLSPFGFSTYRGN
jgi:5-hydroxyisourate hydrolase